MRGGLRLFMTADAVGGVWTYALDLIAGLRPHGVETVLAVLGPSLAPDQRAAATAAGAAEVIEADLPLDWTAESPGVVEEAGRALAELAAPSAPDLIHLNSPALAAAAAFPAPIVGLCHSCVATWWDAVRGGELPEDFRWRTELVRRGYGKAAMLVAPSAAFAAATARLYRVGAPRVVRNGRRALLMPAAAPEPFAFTAGRLWDDGKNLAALDRAAARMSVPVEAAGPTEGPNGTRIAPSHLNLLGRLDEAGIAARLARRPVFVSTAFYEPFGLAVLEAAQAGCALVLSDIPTFRELWDGAASFVSPRDDAAIAAAITSLVGDPERRVRLGEAARARSQAYTVDAMAAGMLAVYRDLLPARTEAA